MSSFPAAATGAIRLSDIDPADTGELSKKEAKEKTAPLLERLYELHYLMYADNKRSLLIVLQGIDGSGKDGTVRHLASGMNPQGFTVRSFKVPNDLERDHDYLWRIHSAAPARGDVAIFNRSHYEEVILPIVHPDVLDAEQLPQEILRKKSLIEQRYRQINDFERIMVENGTSILKFFLLISKEEQQKRFDERLHDPTKQWKFSMTDLLEREHWDRYMDAFQQMIRNTSTDQAPWFVIPADKKWYRNYLISGIVVEHLERLKMAFPTLSTNR
jgi:PPK2 family polyphosphate:nucleotide phosphotransferase